MPKAEPAAKPAIATLPRLVMIASSDNPNLLVSATTYPQAAGGAVTFDLARPRGVPQPFAWWTLNPVSAKREVFQILFHAHDGMLCLAASAPTPNAPMQLAAIAPRNLLQLWTMSADASGNQTICCYGHKTEMGFPDIPLKGLALQLVGDPGTHQTPDTFIITNVVV